LSTGLWKTQIHEGLLTPSIGNHHRTHHHLNCILRVINEREAGASTTFEPTSMIICSELRNRAKNEWFSIRLLNGREGFARINFGARSPNRETADTIERSSDNLISRSAQTPPDPHVKGRCFPVNARARRERLAFFLSFSRRSR
jgi:hypothetical protein